MHLHGGLIIANQIIQDKHWSKYIDETIQQFSFRMVHRSCQEKPDWKMQRNGVLQQGTPALKSGRLEMLENILNSYLHS